MTNSTSTKVVRTSKVVSEKDLLTPYKAAKLVNAELEKAGLSKRIPPQMMYNYTTARVNVGKAALITFNDKTGEVDEAALKVWLTNYIAKQKAIVEAATAE